MAASVHDSSFFTRRGIVAVAIIGLHILMAWALATGLAHKVIEVLAPPIEADIVEEAKDDEPPPPPVPRAAGTPAKMKSTADPDQFYPPGAKRREEQGSPVVQACVGASGKLVREPVVTETSGFPELDGAAVKVAKANRYLPGTDGGQPMAESCVKFKVKFVIKAE